MAAQRLQTGLVYWPFRLLPTSMAATYASLWHSTGVVDYMWIWDMLMGAWPRHLWRPEVTPAASVMVDSDSMCDPFITLGVAATGAPQLGLMVGTNAIRNGPAEVMRAMLTLAGATAGRAIGLVGVSEAYNATPFGYKRSEGLARLEDHLRLYKQLQECEGPFDFEGNFWNYKSAYIGRVWNHKPEMWAMGAGPKLLKLAAQYADGWMTNVPMIGTRVEDYAARVQEVKRMLEDFGRDPEQFNFGVCFIVAVHDDPDVIDSLWHNDLMKHDASMYGRQTSADWRRDGFEPPRPEGWHYALHYHPHLVTEVELRSVLSKMSPEMVESSFAFHGSAKEVAAQIGPYVEAGMTHCLPVDYSVVIQGFEEVPASFGRQVEMCRILKENSGANQAKKESASPV